MRVLVLAEAMPGLTAEKAGAALARGWAGRGHQVAVVPLAATDGDVEGALDGLGAAGRVEVVRPGPAGLDAIEAAASRVDEVWVDLAAWSGAEPAEVVAALGDAGGAGAARERLGGTRLVGLAPLTETTAELTGLRGVASRRAAAARDAGAPAVPIADLLAEDARLQTAAAAVGLPEPPPGAGAVGGLGLAVLALGGTVASAPEALGALAGVPRTVTRADLVVVGVAALDFGTAGGEVVAAARAWATGALVPCVAVCGASRVSARELRTWGVEAAYALQPGTPPTAEALTGLAGRVAASWEWTGGNRTDGADVEAT